LRSTTVHHQRSTNPKSEPTPRTSSAQGEPHRHAAIAEEAQVDLYANYGNGFTPTMCAASLPAPSVAAHQGHGEEIGARSRLFDRWDFGAAFWRLTLDNETVWNGRRRHHLGGDATLRYGVELETRFELTKWLGATAT